MLNPRYIRMGLLALAVACQAPVRDSGQIFRYNESANITSLDPAFARNQANLWAVNQLFEGLLEMNDQLRIQPALAQRYEVRDSGHTYIFHLRSDAYFHRDACFGPDSTRSVTAEDFRYSFERLRNPSLAAPGSWIFQPVDRIEAPDDTTLIIRLRQPFPPFAGLLTMKYASVVPREAVEHYGSEFGRKPVGTGPFYAKLWVENEKLVLRKNPHYHQRDSAGKALPYLEAVAISFIPDKQSAFLEFVKGNLDLISGLDASYKDELLTFSGELQPQYRERFVLYRQPYLNTEYLGFLMDSTSATARDAPWQKRALRQAINYGFDREKMMRYLRNNIGTPARGGMIPAGLASYDPARTGGYTYDPAKARQLLAEAGYPRGEGLPEITLQTNASYLDLCEYIQGELAGLGIPLQVEVTPPSTLRQAMATGKVAFFRGSWIADYPDAENYMSLFYSPNAAPDGPNYTRFSHPQFDRWYDEALHQPSDSTRQRLYQRMDSLIVAEAPVVPLYYDQVLRFFPKNIAGLQGNAMNMLSLKKVYKKPVATETESRP